MKPTNQSPRRPAAPLVAGFLLALLAFAPPALPADAGAAIVRGPWLQRVAADSVVVMWQTATPSRGRVEYGVAGPDEAAVRDSVPVRLHEVALTGLAAGTAYAYRISSGAARERGSFTTAPASAGAPFRFAAYGDTRSNPAVHARLADAILARRPAFVIHVGDFTSRGRGKDQWGPQFFAPAAALLRNAPLFTVLGNHEFRGSGPLRYLDFFSLPGNERWYAFTYGSVRFVALDACDGGDPFSPGSPQYVWLRQELASPAFTGARWRVVWFHQPPYPALEKDGSISAAVREHLVPLFEQAGVDVVFNGDDHLYRHSVRNRIHYVVTGGGGAPLHRPGTPSPGADLVIAEKTYEYCVVDVAPETLSVNAYRIDGSPLDAFTLAAPSRLPRLDKPPRAAENK